MRGGANGYGTIFSVPVTGGTPTTLLSFNGTNGGDSHNSLTLSPDGSTLYGITTGGGAYGDGTIFSILATGGTPTTLASFNGTNGEGPGGSLTLSGSTLYGSTAYGGANGDGNVFSIPVTGGTPTVLASFNGTNGETPVGNLTLSGSTLYGTTELGGNLSLNNGQGEGTVFALSVPGIGPQNFTEGGGPTTVGGAEGAFTDVTSPGTFSANFFEPTTSAALTADVGAAAAGSIDFALPGGRFQFWDLGFTGTFTGDVTVTLHFDPSILYGTPLADLHVEHYTNGAWVLPANQVVDTVNDTITFTTDSFSPFMLADISSPEPSSVVLLGLGALALAAAARRRMRARAV